MKLLEDYLDKDEIKWQALFYVGKFHKEFKQDNVLKPLIDFLCEKVSFWYHKDIFSDNPFAPLADFTIIGGGRSSDLSDLNNEDLIKIDECIQYTSHPLILGFLNDILGIVRNNNENRLKATKNFIEYSKNLLSKHEFCGLTLQPIKRAFALLCQLKDAKGIENFVDEFLNYDIFERKREYQFKVTLIKMFYTKNQKIYDKLLPYCDCLYNKYESETEYIFYSIQLAKIILKIYKSRGDKNKIKEWAVAYAEKCCESNISLINISKELDTAIEETNKLKNFELTNKLRIKKKQLEEDIFKSFHMNTVPLEIPKQLKESMKATRNHIIEKFKELDGISQFCYFLSHFTAVSKTEIEEQLKQDNSFQSLDLFNKIRFNEKNEIIFQSVNASEKQKIENKTYEVYKQEGVVVFALIVQPFIDYVKDDDECVSFIKDLVDHNELVYRNRSVVVQNIENGIFKKQIRSALAGLLPQVEDGIRNYIEKKGIIPVIRSGGNEINASLGQMMNNDIFRKLIDELIGEDLSQHIDYLACKELGGNLRNVYAHEGYGDDKQFSIDEAILFFLIFKAYCMGYDDEINSP